MDIREQIAYRITKARKELGITIKELSSRTTSLSPARISNWEQGTRSPGPIEAMILAEQLNVSASYLLCLTDNSQGELALNKENGMRYVPILSTKEAVHAKETVGHNSFSNGKAIVAESFNKSIKSLSLFAIMVEDNSMQPEFNSGDVVIVDGALEPRPGNYVIAYLTQKKQTVLRKYGEADGCLFQLLANNELWATINVKQPDEFELIGVIVEIRKYLG